MASLIHDPNGRKRVLFVDPAGVRKAVRLGKASKKQGEMFKAGLSICWRSNSPARWTPIPRPG